MTWELLSDLLPHLVDFMLVTYEPGGRSSSSGKLTRHSGTEFAFLLSGTLKVQVGFTEYVLRPGDSMAFDSSEPHLLVNEGTEPAVGLWFVLGRRQAARGARGPARSAATAAHPAPRRLTSGTPGLTARRPGRRARRPAPGVTESFSSPALVPD